MVMGFSVCEQHGVLTLMTLNLSQQGVCTALRVKNLLFHKTEQGLQFLFASSH